MIITEVILIFTALVVVASFYATNRSAQAPNGNILFGITLPYEALNHPDVLKIMKSFQKAYTRLIIVFIALCVPLLFLYDYISISLFYFTGWIFLYLLLNEIISSSYYGKLRSLKQRNSWWVGSCHIVTVDTQVSRLKNLFPVSRKWFALPLLFSVTPIALLAFAQNRDATVLPVVVSGLVATFASYFIYHITVKDKTTVYSSNSEINLAINRLYKRQLSLCWIIVAVIGSALSFISFFILSVAHTNNLLFAAITCANGTIIVPIIYFYSKIRTERSRLLEADNQKLYVDADEFWTRLYYNNPNESRMFVEKRIGYGMTVNIGIPSGKAWNVVTNILLVLSLVFFIGFAIYLAPFDFDKREIIISDDLISVAVPYDLYEFKTEDILDVTLIHALPHASKKSGLNIGRAYYGDFYMRGYGLCKVYVNPKHSPYILIELTDEWIFLNGDNEEQTEACYRLIKKVSAIPEQVPENGSEASKAIE